MYPLINKLVTSFFISVEEHLKSQYKKDLTDALCLVALDIE